MPIFTVPSDDADLLLEHSDPSRPNYPHGKGGEQKRVIRQTGVKSHPVSASLSQRLQALALTATDEDDKSNEMFAMVRNEAPALVAEVEKLIARGKKGQPEFEKLSRDLAAEFGFDYHTNIQSREIFEKDTDWVVVGDTKSVKRSAIKTALDYVEKDPQTGQLLADPSKVKDVVRGTITVRNADEMVDVLARLGEKVELVDVKNNITKPMRSGYRDINVVMRLPSGILAEMQIITKPMLQAKMTIGHKLYEAWRVLDPKSARAGKLMAEQVKLYGGAWAASAMSALFISSQLPSLVDTLRSRFSMG